MADDSKILASRSYVNRAVSNTAPGVAQSYSDSERYFAPITYWWADFWTPGGNWDRTLENPDVLGPVIINIGNGPGAAPDADWLAQVKIARSRGAHVIGYVSTAYGVRSENEILGDIAKHKAFYGVDGVFLDEMTNGVDTNAKFVPAYKRLYDKIKAQYGKGFWVVGNPGTSTSEDVLQCADTVMVYESDADYYLNPTWDIHPSYYAKYQRTKFWHVVHSVRDWDQARAVFDTASRLRPGFLYVTDLRFDAGASNPYAKPPSQWLLDAQVGWARGLEIGRGRRSVHIPSSPNVDITARLRELADTPDDGGFVNLVLDAGGVYYSGAFEWDFYRVNIVGNGASLRPILDDPAKRPAKIDGTNAIVDREDNYFIKAKTSAVLENGNAPVHHSIISTSGLIIENQNGYRARLSAILFDAPGPWPEPETMHNDEKRRLACFTLTGLVFRHWRIALDAGEHFYMTAFDDIGFADCEAYFRMRDGSFDSGERITFKNCKITSAGPSGGLAGLTIERGWCADIYHEMCSFDWTAKLANVKSGTHVGYSQCHIETPQYAMLDPLKVTSENAYFVAGDEVQATFDQCTFSLNTSADESKAKIPFLFAVGNGSEVNLGKSWHVIDHTIALMDGSRDTGRLTIESQGGFRAMPSIVRPMRALNAAHSLSTRAVSMWEFDKGFGAANAAEAASLVDVPTGVTGMPNAQAVKFKQGDTAGVGYLGFTFSTLPVIPRYLGVNFTAAADPATPSITLDRLAVRALDASGDELFRFNSDQDPWHCGKMLLTPKASTHQVVLPLDFPWIGNVERVCGFQVQFYGEALKPGDTWYLGRAFTDRW